VGEAIRAQETVFQLQNIDRLQAEGAIPIGYHYLIDRRAEVIAKPAPKK
jgi:hypothetical protein